MGLLPKTRHPGQFRAPYLSGLRGALHLADPSREPWFVAADVCRCIGLENNRKALMALAAEEKGVTICNTPGGPQRMRTITESGLYKLVLRAQPDRPPAGRRREGG
ncbi:MAG TPA: Bro-N domain-containing protein [Dehalococcoidia bacterium]|nr:Bro-N domain-containing protein [Dehalococcoidia bacterium]